MVAKFSGQRNLKPSTMQSSRTLGGIRPSDSGKAEDAENGRNS